MRDEQTARDAAAGALETYLGDTAWQRWDMAQSVLSALGIPPTTPIDDVKAGLDLVRILRTADQHDAYAGILRNPVRGKGNEWNVWFDPLPSYHGPDVIAAVLALADKLDKANT